MVIFFAIMTAVVAGTHAYVGWRALAATRLGTRGRRVVWLLLAASTLTILVVFGLGRIFEPGLPTRVLSWVGFSLLGIIGIFFSLFLFRDELLLLGRLLGRFSPKPRATPRVRDGLSRREVLLRSSSLAALGAGSVVVAGSWIQAHRQPAVESVPVLFPTLPPALDGFRVAQISDLHLGPTLGRTFAEEITARVNALEPDVIAVTGDLIDGWVPDLAPEVQPLAGLRAKHGVYFVTGNHEYYWDAPAWSAHLRTLGWHVLTNEHRVLRIQDAALALGGVTDISAGGFFPDQASDAVRAYIGAPEPAFRLLLAHQPRSLYGAQRANVDLMLSGHTHAGQVFPMTLFVHLAHPIVQGLGRFDRTWVYVNRGTAYWGPPMRTGERGEITLVELRRST